MANGYKVRLFSAVSDGTNIFTEVEIQGPGQTYPIIRPVFKVGTTAAQISAYLQVIANNAPTLAADVSAIIGQFVNGA